MINSKSGALQSSLDMINSKSGAAVFICDAVVFLAAFDVIIVVIVVNGGVGCFQRARRPSTGSIRS